MSEKQAQAETITPLDPERVRQISATLNDEPSGCGDPISERETWSRLAELKGFQDVVSAAIETANEPIVRLTEEVFLDYSQTGKQTAYAEFEAHARPAFARLVLAECIDNKGRFLDRIHQAIAALCDERTWVHSFHDPKLDNWHGRKVEIDLRVASISWSLSTACHFLGARLETQTRERVRHELQRRTFAPFRLMRDGSPVMLNQPKPFSWLTLRHNWNSSCLGGVVSSALTMIESKEERAHYVAAASAYIQNFLSGFPADGSCSEGIGYWGGGFTHFVMLAEHIRQATGGALDLLASAHVEQVARYGARLQILPKTYPAFADCHPHPTPPADLMRFVSLRYGMGLKSWEEMEPEPSNLQNLAVYAFPNSATAKKGTVMPARRELRSWFSEAGLFVGRPSADAPGALGVAFKGGHNGEFHNHNDLGSFVVAINQKLLLLDPGSEAYTSRTFSDRRYDSKLLNSYGHSVPVVAGVLQRTGGVAQAPVLRTDFDDAEDLVTYDLRSAYDVEDLVELSRTFCFSRRGSGRLTVKDTVKFRRPHSFGTALITTAQWRQEADNCLIISDGQDALRVEVKVEGGMVEIVAETIQEEARTENLPVRIGINLTVPSDRATIELIIEPGIPVETEL